MYDKKQIEALCQDLADIAPDALDPNYNHKYKAWDRLGRYLDKELNQTPEEAKAIAHLIGFALTASVAKIKDKEDLCKWLDRLSGLAEKAFAAIPNASAGQDAE